MPFSARVEHASAIPIQAARSLATLSNHDIDLRPRVRHWWCLISKFDLSATSTDELTAAISVTLTLTARPTANAAS